MQLHSISSSYHTVLSSYHLSHSHTTLSHPHTTLSFPYHTVSSSYHMSHSHTSLVLIPQSHPHTTLSHSHTTLSHSHTTLSHPRTTLSHSHTTLSHSHTTLSHSHTTSSSPYCIAIYHCAYVLVALTPQNTRLSTSTRQREHGVQWQLNRGHSPGHVAVQFNRHSNRATATVDTVVVGKLQAACISKIPVEPTPFLACIFTTKQSIV